MSKKKKLPPSQIRYRKAHPTISCVLTSELKGIMDRVRDELSYSEYMKKLLTENADFCKESYTIGYEEGYKEAEAKYRIEVECSICKKPVTILRNSEDHRTLAKISKRWLAVSHKDWVDRSLKKLKES